MAANVLLWRAAVGRPPPGPPGDVASLTSAGDGVALMVLLRRVVLPTTRDETGDLWDGFLLCGGGEDGLVP